MKLEIELDLNNIDYDAINKQIAEKIAALNIKDIYDIESKINNKISNLVKEEVDYSYNKYIDKYWRDATSDGRELIESMSKAEIENRTKQVIEEIFANDYNEDIIREVMLKTIPDIFTSILFTRIESALFSKEFNYRNEIHNMVRSQIASAIGRNAY